MAILVTGSAGHLGEALMRTLFDAGCQAIGLDIKQSPFTHRVGSIVDRKFVKRCMADVHAVFPTATLHKPHVATHTRQDFVDTNITGTLIYWKRSRRRALTLSSSPVRQASSGGP